MGQPAQALVHDEINPCELWIHYRALPALNQSVSSVPELQIEQEGVCKGCALGKNIKNPFPSSDNRSKQILDLIHSIVCGHMPVRSLGGSLHYVTFIDDFSHMT